MRVRQDLGSTVSKGTLFKVPGFGTLNKVHLEVSAWVVGAYLKGRREHTRS